MMSRCSHARRTNSRRLTPDWMILTVGVRRVRERRPYLRTPIQLDAGHDAHGAAVRFHPQRSGLKWPIPTLDESEWTTEDLRVLFRGRGLRFERAKRLSQQELQRPARQLGE